MLGKGIIFIIFLLVHCLFEVKLLLFFNPLYSDSYLKSLVHFKFEINTDFFFLQTPKIILLSIFCFLQSFSSFND